MMIEMCRGFVKGVINITQKLSEKKANDFGLLRMELKKSRIYGENLRRLQNER